MQWFVEAHPSPNAVVLYADVPPDIAVELSAVYLRPLNIGAALERETHALNVLHLDMHAIVSE